MARTPVTEEDERRGQRMRVLRAALGLTQEQVLGAAKRPQIVEAENGRDRLRGQLLFHYAAATGLKAEKLRAYAFDEGVSLDALLADRQLPAPVSSASAPVRTYESDRQRDRLWLETALKESGVQSGRAAEVALHFEMIDGESPAQTLARAKLTAGHAEAESKGKLLGRAPQQPHPKKPPKVGR